MSKAFLIFLSVIVFFPVLNGCGTTPEQANALASKAFTFLKSDADSQTVRSSLPVASPIQEENTREENSDFEPSPSSSPEPSPISEVEVSPSPSSSPSPAPILMIGSPTIGRRVTLTLIDNSPDYYSPTFVQCRVNNSYYPDLYQYLEDPSVGSFELNNLEAHTLYECQVPSKKGFSNAITFITSTGCGDNVCDMGETQSTCPSDCGYGGPVCGNTVCEINENYLNCSGECSPDASPTPEPSPVAEEESSTRVGETSPSPSPDVPNEEPTPSETPTPTPSESPSPSPAAEEQEPDPETEPGPACTNPLTTAPASTPVASPEAVIPRSEDFERLAIIKKAYSTCLGREGTPEEFDAWLQAGEGYPLSQVWVSICNSGEAADPGRGRVVYTSFMKCLGHPPSSDQLNYWVTLVTIPTQTLEHHICYSPEAVLRESEMNIERAYKTCLKREVKPNEKADWLALRKKPSVIYAEICNSPEAERKAKRAVAKCCELSPTELNTLRKLELTPMMLRHVPCDRLKSLIAEADKYEASGCSWSKASTIVSNVCNDTSTPYTAYKSCEDSADQFLDACAQQGLQGSCFKLIVACDGISHGHAINVLKIRGKGYCVFEPQNANPAPLGCTGEMKKNLPANNEILDQLNLQGDLACKTMGLPPGCGKCKFTEVTNEKAEPRDPLMCMRDNRGYKSCQECCDAYISYHRDNNSPRWTEWLSVCRAGCGSRQRPSVLEHTTSF